MMWLGKIESPAPSNPAAYVITDKASWMFRCDDFQKMNNHTANQIDQIATCLQDSGNFVVIDIGDNFGDN